MIASCICKITLWLDEMLSAMKRSVLWNSKAIEVRGVPWVLYEAVSWLALIMLLFDDYWQETPIKTDVLSRSEESDLMKG